MRNQTTCFRQEDEESLFEALEMYKELLWSFTRHGLDKWLIVYTFYNGCLYYKRMTLDIAAKGALMNKPYDDVFALIEYIT